MKLFDGGSIALTLIALFGLSNVTFNGPNVHDGLADCQVAVPGTNATSISLSPECAKFRSDPHDYSVFDDPGDK